MKPHPFSIPLNRPSLFGREWTYIRDAVKRGQLSGDGFYTRRCSALLAKRLGVPAILLTPSCTHALELAFQLADLPRGGEVLCPSFTFSSTANAFLLAGLTPRFVDIRPDTLNLDETQLDARATKKTCAVVPVHYAGVPCEMDAIQTLSRKRGWVIIEDAAQALGATYRKKPVGSFGIANAFSFHETKNITCGEGGALAITDPAYFPRAEIMRQKGTNRAQFFRGEVDKYTWVDIGSSYVPSELQSAYLLAQLEHLTDIARRRRVIYERYFEACDVFERRGILQRPALPAHVRSSYHLFHLMLESPKLRRRVLEGLQQEGIYATFHYVPLHLSPMGKRFGYRKGDFPVSERAGDCLVRLPFYNTLTEQDQTRVIRALHRYL